MQEVKNRIKKFNDKKALIDEELEPLFIREEELENEEIIAIYRKNNITISDLTCRRRWRHVSNSSPRSGSSVRSRSCRSWPLPGSHCT